MLSTTVLTDRIALQPAYDLPEIVARLHAIFSLDDPPLISLGVAPDGPRPLQPDEVAMYLWQEHTRSSSICYALSLRASEDLLGTLSILVPNPADHPVGWSPACIHTSPAERLRR